MGEQAVTVVEVKERSGVAQTRWRALDAAARAGFDNRDAARLGLVATEAATNLLKHAGGGEVLVSQSSGTRAAVDLVAIDRGPGMANVGQCMTDGFSTAGGPGNGLGAIRRQSDRLDIFSVPELGTTLVATIASPAGFIPPRPTWVEGITVAKPGETECGDSWCERRLGDRTGLMLCDGLGHGPRAAVVAREAESAFAELQGSAVEDWILTMNDRLRRTRGAAIGMAVIDPEKNCVRFAGVGNIAGWLRSDAGEQRTFSVEGIAGRDGWRPKPVDYGFEGDLLAVFSSDGLATRWDLARYRGLATRDPLTIAAVLYRDFRRLRDDCTVVVARVHAS